MTLLLAPLEAYLRWRNHRRCVTAVALDRSVRRHPANVPVPDRIAAAA